MNLLFDSLNDANLDQSYEGNNEYGYFLHEDCLVPKLFEPQKQIIKCYTVDKIDDLDFFIYPINFCDPVSQSLGDRVELLKTIDKRVIQRIKNNTGVLLIDATYEPLGIKKSLDIKNQISTMFGTENIFINIKIFSLYSNDTFFTDFPSFLEYHSLRVFMRDEIEVTTPKKFCLFGSRIEKHRGGMQLIRWLKEKNLISQGHISLTRDNKKDNNAPIIIRSPLTTDVLNYVKFNIVVEAWFTSDSKLKDFSLLTEKIFRNIHYRKPFILVGQHSTLAEFRKLGYKTYNEIFDESYDLEKNDDSRLDKAFTQIKRLIDEPDDFWQKNKDKLDAIHKHNLDNYENRLTKLQKFYEEIRPR